jgi:S1-C subfamily serine protease
MPDNTNEPPAPTAPARGASPVASARSRSTPAGPPATTTPSGGPSPASRPTEAKRRLHPLWLVAGAIALFALVFGVGSVAQGEESSSAPSGTTIEASTISTIQTVDPSVVQIQAKGQGPGGSVGSGEILTTSGYIVTNSHVVHGFSTYTVLLSSGQTVPAQLVGDAPSQDIAVLKINPGDLNLKPIALADSSKVQVGEFAIAMGSPLGLEQSATSGIVSSLNREGTELVDGNRYTLKGMIQTSAPINPGNSGGALVNLKGQLIGIPTLAAVDASTGVAANGIGYAISSNTMQSVVHQLSNGAAG